MLVAVSAVAAAGAAACNTSAFSHSIDGVQCLGFEQRDGVSSSAECADACCTTAGCESWVYQSAKGCWIAAKPCSGPPDPVWRGASKLPPATPPPPAPPPVWTGLPRLTPRAASVSGVETTYQLLHGEWEFDPAPPPRDATGAFTGEPNWTSIVVPGEYTLQGHRVLQGATTAYRQAFTLPSDWLAKGLRRKLRFDGVYSGAEVWVNGERAGSHLGGFTPFELDITGMSGNGTIIVDVAVTGSTLADALASASKYASHDLGGITRKVQAFVVPEVCVSDVYPVTSFSGGYTRAAVTVNLTVANDGAAPAAAAAQVTLRNSSAVAAAVHNVKFTVPANSQATEVVTLDVPSPAKWDPEHPYLYDLVVELVPVSAAASVTSRRTGIREVAVVGNRVLVNGQAVKARGSTRHETHPTWGRSLWNVVKGGGVWVHDVKTFRDMNVNWIRTSHYPPGEEFVQAADEMGMLVELEMPFCWARENVGSTDLAYTVQAQLEAVTFYRGHAAVVAWSLGNESPWLRNFQTSYSDFVKRADVSRPFMFDGGSGAPGPTKITPSWIATRHYPGLGMSAKDAHGALPVLYGEYGHLNCYNRREILTDPGVRDAWGFGIEAMWEEMWAAEGVLGGCFWAGIDDEFWMPSGKPVGYGEWGLVDGWRRAKPETWIVQNIYSTVKPRIPIAAGWEPTITVENRHDFTDLSEVSFSWAAEDGSAGVGRAAGGPRATAPLELVGLRPGAGAVTVNATSPRGFLITSFRIDPLPDATTCAGELRERVSSRTCVGLSAVADALTPENCAAACCEARRTGGCDTWVFGEGAECFIGTGGCRGGAGEWSGWTNVTGMLGSTAAPPVVQPLAGGGVSVSAAGRRWNVTGAGRLSGACAAGGRVLTSGPDMMVLADNEEGATQLSESTPPYQPFTDSLAGWRGANVTWRVEGTDAVVSVTGSYTDASGAFELRFRPDGGVTAAYDFEWEGGDVVPRQIGLVFTVPAGMRTLSWKRRGQWTVYPSTHIGRESGTAAANPGPADLGPEPPAGRPWGKDTTPLGTNEFRSTKHSFSRFGVAAAGVSLTALSNETQHGRAWVAASGAVRVLVADVSTEGGNKFSRERVMPTVRVGKGVRLRGEASLQAGC